MAEKKLNARIIHKHDTEANWSKATTFIPKQGEIIIYDKDNNYDYERIKVGDGSTVVTNLAFYGGSGVENIEDGLAAGSLKSAGAAAETAEYRLGENAVALGKDTKASANAAYAEGGGNTASGNYSHAEGYNTVASGGFAHAEGRKTTASGSAAHASGYGTIAKGNNQTVIGKYNVEDSSEYAFIIGGGSGTAGAEDERANIFTVSWDGDAAANGNTLATRQYVDANGGKIDTIKVNGTEQTITNKAVNISVPTNTSELNNDSGFLTAHQDISGKADKATTLAGYGIGDAYTKTEVDTKFDAIPSQTDYSVTLETDAATLEYSKVYTLKQCGASIGSINIPKDLVVESGQVVTKAESGEWGLAGTYIELVLANTENEKIYIEVGSLIEYVTSGSTAEDQIQIEIDEQHKVTATLKKGSVTKVQLDSELAEEIANGNVLAVNENSNMEQVIEDYFVNKKYKSLVYAPINGVQYPVPDYYLPLVDVYSDDATIYFRFSGVRNFGDNDIYITKAEWTSFNEYNNGWNVRDEYFYTVPEPTTSIEGKVLQVVDSSWQASALELVATDDGDGNVTLSIN